MNDRPLLFATGTRADWGLLQPIAAEMRRLGQPVEVLATNMHLSERYGHTVDEIRAAGFEPAALVALPDGDSAAERCRAMGVCLSDTAAALERLRPCAVVILGDRYEMLAVASACLMLRIPIIHLHGGEITAGAVDDAIRNAITQMSSLHLTSTEPYRRRVIAMGADPASVVNTGAIGVWNVAHFANPDPAELHTRLNLDQNRPTMMVTYHPVTLDDADPGERCQAMLNALDRFADYQLIITYPNNDARSLPVIECLKSYAEAHPDRVRLVKSLGMKLYATALPLMKAVVGNSSSGILEAPSAGVPTVDIGSRQQGRLSADSVIHCAEDTDAIARAITQALSPEFQALAARCQNPYCQPDTLGRITAAICHFISSLK